MVFRLRTTAQAAGDSLMQSEGYVNKVTVATHGDRIPFSGPCASGDHHHVWILANGRQERAGTRTHEINVAASLPQSVIAVGATNVDPSQSVWRPRPAPAAVVGGIGVGYTNTNERK